MNNKREIIESLLIIAFFPAIVFSLNYYGSSHVKYLKTPQIKTIGQPYHAVNVWADNGLHGRILFLFDRHLNADPGDGKKNDMHSDKFKEEQITADNYIYYAIQQDFVRKIYHIIPDSSWPEVESVLTKYPLVALSDGIFRMITGEAVPVYILRLRDIPKIKEKVIIQINGDFWDDSNMASIADLLGKNILNADLITVSGKISEDSLKRIELHSGRI